MIISFFLISNPQTNICTFWKRPHHGLTYFLGSVHWTFNSVFFQAFNLPNVHLISDSIDRLYDKGLVTKTKDQFGNVDEKSYEFDVIILATGKGSFFNYSRLRNKHMVRGLSKITFALRVGRWSEKQVVYYIKSAN